MLNRIRNVLKKLRFQIIVSLFYNLRFELSAWLQVSNGLRFELRAWFQVSNELRFFAKTLGVLLDLITVSYQLKQFY